MRFVAIAVDLLSGKGPGGGHTDSIPPADGGKAYQVGYADGCSSGLKAAEDALFLGGQQVVAPGQGGVQGLLPGDGGPVDVPRPVELTPAAGPSSPPRRNPSAGWAETSRMADPSQAAMISPASPCQVPRCSPAGGSVDDVADGVADGVAPAGQEVSVAAFLAAIRNFVLSFGTTAARGTRERSADVALLFRLGRKDVAETHLKGIALSSGGALSNAIYNACGIRVPGRSSAGFSMYR